jgi:hypothetical protein
MAALALGPAACLDDPTYNGGYGGVRSPKAIEQEPQPPQPGQPVTSQRGAPSPMESVRGPRAEVVSPAKPAAGGAGGAVSFVVVHEVEAGESFLRVLDNDGTEVCRLAEGQIEISYDFIVTTCGLAP